MAKLTDEEISKYRDLFREGETMRQISKQLGRSYECIRDRIYRDIGAGVLEDRPRPRGPIPQRKRKTKPKARPKEPEFKLTPPEPKRGRGAPRKTSALYKDGVRQVAFIRADLHRLLRLAAADRHTGASEIINDALTEYFERHPISI